MSLWIDNSVSAYTTCSSVPIYSDGSVGGQVFEVEVDESYIKISLLEASNTPGWNLGFSLACTSSSNILIYKIVSGNENGLFSVDMNNGNIYLNKSLDYEIKSLHSFIVGVFDSEFSAEVTVGISVSDVNEKPIVDNTTTVYINEDAVTGTIADGVVRFHDPDQGQLVQGSVVADSNVFASAGIWSHGSSRVELLLNSIDNNKIIGRWINEERPEFEGELFGLNGTMTFPDDTTYIFSLDSTLKIIRWSNSGEWKLLSGSTLQKIIFDIEPLTGKVYLSQGTLDFEYRENYLISVLFSDSDIDNQKNVTRFISIRVKDVNEAPIFDGPVKREENIATYEFSVEEEIAQNQVVRLGTWIERGGYRDRSSRALRHGPHAYGYTAASCQKACHNWNGISYKYFALQDNGWCCCDNDWKEVTKYGKKILWKNGWWGVQLCL
jgi:hypothetical protein